MSDKYFATLATDEVGQELKSRIDNYYDYCSRMGIWALWANSYQKYFSGFDNAGFLMQGGELAEYTIYKENQYRNVLEYVTRMVTKEMPAGDCIATNSDIKSMAQAQVANSLLEYYIKEKNLQSFLKKAARSCIAYGEAYIESIWNPNIGEKLEPFDPQSTETTPPFTEKLSYKGDLEFNTYFPTDTIRDVFANSSDEAKNWVIVRKQENKWDLVAKYPEKADEIIALNRTDRWLETEINNYDTFNYRNDDCDLVMVYKFYHRPSNALPQGRQILLINDSLILLDTTLPYKDIPIVRMASSELDGSIFGYSVAFDILNVQEALDNVNSIIMTNILTHGVSNIAMPVGSNLVPDQMVRGLNVITFDPQIGVPQAINFTATPGEIYQYRQELIRTLETLSGLSSTSRGDPPTNLKSGNALALVESRAIEFNSDFEATYTKAFEWVATQIVNLLRTFATVERNALIAGKSKRSQMLQFTGDDLGEINRVMVQPANPLSKTIAGRTQVAENLIANGMITTAKQYIQVLTTGILDPLIQHEQAELDLIAQENELLSKGEFIRALPTDTHELHVPEHMTVLASIEARQDPKRIEATLAHIQEHRNLYANSDPILLQLSKQQPPNVPAIQPGITGGNPQVLNNQDPAQQKAGNIPLPNDQNIKPPKTLLENQEPPEEASYVQ